MKYPEILVVGAYGYTARMILENLVRLNIPFQVCGRDKQKLLELREIANDSFPVRVHDIQDPRQFEDILSGIDVVINCAGPYHLLSSEFLRAVSDWSGIYIDLTGELDFVLESIKELDEKCKANNSLIVHSCAFESMLSELLLSQIASHDTSYKDISSYYTHYDEQMSPGTKLTAKLAGTHRSKILREGKFREIRKDEMIRTPDLEFVEDDMLAYYSPLPEVAFFANDYHTQNAASYLLLPTAEAQFLSGLPPKKEIDTERVVQKFKRRKATGPDLNERQQHRFRVIVETLDENSNRCLIAAEGADPYGLTAHFVSKTLVYLLNQSTLVGGVKSPGAILPAAEILEELVTENRISVSTQDILDR